MTDKAARAALRESIPVTAEVDPEQIEKAGLVVEELTPEIEETPAETEELIPETPAEEENVEEKKYTQAQLNKRIAKEVEKTRIEREAREATEARLLALEKKEGKTELTPAEIREQARLEGALEATKKIEFEQFVTATDNLIAMAEKEIPNFNKRYDEFVDNVDQLPRNMIDSLLHLENGHSVLNHLIKNSEEAEKIMKMSEKRQTIELAKLSEKVAAPKTKKLVAKAPEPIKTVGGAVKTTSAPSDSDSDAAWIEKRIATREKRVYR